MLSNIEFLIDYLDYLKTQFVGMDLNNWTEHNQQLASETGQAQMDSDLILFLKRLNFHFLGFIYTRRKNQNMVRFFWVLISHVVYFFI